MLAYERLGTGEPLVLIHGITHRRQAWYPVVDQLVDHREVILIDLPGHGESPDLELKGRSVKEALQDELVAFLHELGLERPHMAGNSLGGRIALEAGADDLARSVTALSPAGFWNSGLEVFYTRNLFRTMTTLAQAAGPVAPFLAHRAWGRQIMFRWITEHPERFTPEAVLGDTAGLLRALPALRTIMNEISPFERDLVEGVPLTIAWGTKDRVLPPRQGKRAAAVMPEGRHVPLHGCGHVPMIDNPDLVARVLLSGSRSLEAIRADGAAGDLADLIELRPRRRGAA